MWFPKVKNFFCHLGKKWLMSLAYFASLWVLDHTQKSHWATSLSNKNSKEGWNSRHSVQEQTDALETTSLKWMCWRCLLNFLMLLAMHIYIWGWGVLKKALCFSLLSYLFFILLGGTPSSAGGRLFLGGAEKSCSAGGYTCTSYVQSMCSNH